MSMDAKGKYKADGLVDLLGQKQSLNWLIEHWLEQGTFALLVGAEGSFKSFLAIDWALSIATGQEWNGCRVAPGRVLYIAGEGHTGVIRRMRGWSDHHGRVADDVFLGHGSVELVTPSDVVRLEDYLRDEQWALIVIDTLARNFGPGSENDAETMSAAIASVDRIRKSSGATVLVVHHAPLEGRREGKLRPRGSSALSGAADAIFTCSHDQHSDVITVASTKQKDAPNPETQFLSFDIVDLGETDNFGNPITTLVLCPTHKRPTFKRKLGPNQRRVIQELRSRANGSNEILVAIRDITGEMGISRQARKIVESWFDDQPWAKSTSGGHLVNVPELPGG